MTIKPESRPIPGFDGYFASEDGHIYSTRQGGSPHRLKPGPVGWRHVYLGVMVSPRRGAKFQMKTVQSLVALTFIGPKPFSSAVVRHLDDVKTNNAACNLAWGTRKENSADATKNNLIPHGSERDWSKLTESDIPVIRNRLTRGDSCLTIAGDYSVCEATITAVKLGRRWRHVPLQ